MEERLTELESKFSFQEALLNELNEVLIKQQRQVDTLAARLTQLQEMLEELSTAQQATGPISPDQEKPPHY